MTDYPLDMQLVVDPLNPENVVRDGAVYLYDPSDEAGVSPIALKDPSGLPLPNPLVSNPFGFIPPSIVTIPKVKWKSGAFEGFFFSYDGLRNEAIAARAAAEIAQAAAVTAGADAAAAAQAALAGAVADAAESAVDAAAAQASALAAQASAAAAAATAAGGGMAVHPTDPDILIISTKLDGTVAVKPTDSDVLTITT
ncbi:hypothetical protein [Pseudarthrobacter cellobiosi]|uniref:hypothetical protein n=1 Tax=Pseudarthrobacter cellobiosi TaxID=2953654 RepID=UPI00208E0497|nr:hypothetical protein [Pseudarthrobacter sp. HLT1-5]MCO4256522.1 hypothetical protein [Pseudarthrobacter sp. HLT1-5]